MYHRGEQTVIWQRVVARIHWKESTIVTSSQSYGLVIGLVLGIVWMWLGFDAALLASATGLLGWLAGTVASSIASGNLSVTDLWNDLQGRRRAQS